MFERVPRRYVLVSGTQTVSPLPTDKLRSSGDSRLLENVGLFG